MIPIFMWTLWRRRWSIFWWSLGVAVYMALVIAVYPSFRNQSAALNNSINQIPQSVKSLISDTDNLFSPIGYLSSNAYYLMMPIIFGVLGIGLGSSLLAKDEQEHTLELILSRPVSRGAVLAGRAFAGLAIILAVAATTSVATILFAWFAKLGISDLNLVETTGMAALLTLIFASLVFAMTAFGKSARIMSTGLPTLLLIASYLFTSLSGTVDWLKWPSRLLPYHYYHPAQILSGDASWREALGMTIAILFFGALSYIGFRRRDID
jgi:ABC-2 type transport system permease protein